MLSSVLARISAASSHAVTPTATNFIHEGRYIEAHPKEAAAAMSNLQVAAAILWVIALVQFKMENVADHKVFPI